MNLRFARTFSCFTAGLAFFCPISPTLAQTTDHSDSSFSSSLAKVSSTEQQEALPEAPRPRTLEVSDDVSLDEDRQTPVQAPASGGPSSAGTSPAVGQQGAPGVQGKPITTPESQRDVAEDQLKKEQKQRVLGVLPNFNTSYVYGAASLTAKQKFHLAFRSATDPVQFLGVTPFVALIGQAEGSHYAYGGGWGGYAKRYGQTYADNFDGTMIGNAILPSLLHQDPRYFRLGRGSKKRRILYALGTNIITRHDGTGHWEPNYSNVIGNFAAGGISNIYLPSGERGFSSTVTGALTVTAEGGLGSMFQEFWPDISRHFLHKDPTDGQDAINASTPDPTQGRNPFSNHHD